MAHIANVEMAAAWDGHEGAHWTEYADRYERSTWRHWRVLEKAAAVAAGDRVLDVGCGTGKSTRSIARRAGAGGSVLGVDLSSRMVEEARRRAAAEGLANVAFEHGDAQVHPFAAAAYDGAVSSFGVMFFADPVTAFANVAGALRPGGTLAVLAWRELARNEWLLAFREVLAAGRTLPEPPAGAPGPLGLADGERTRGILATAGFVDVELESVDEPVEFGADADDAYSFASHIGVVEGLTRDLDEPTRAATLDRLHAMLAAHETPEGVLLGSSAWLVTGRRP